MSAAVKAGLNPLMPHLLVLDMETSNDNKGKPGRNEQSKLLHHKDTTVSFIQEAVSLNNWTAIIS